MLQTDCVGRRFLEVLPIQASCMVADLTVIVVLKGCIFIAPLIIF